MRPLEILFASLLVVQISLPASADEAKAAYKRGVHAEAQNHYDEAFRDYSRAHSLKPKDARYFTSFTRLRFYAAVEHVHQGQKLRDAGELPESVVEFQKAAEIDPTNFVAKGEAQRTAQMIEKQARRSEDPKPTNPLDQQAEAAAGPIELEPLSATLINLRLSDSASVVYKTIGKLAGINVLFDQDFKSQKVTMELNNVTLLEALDTVALQTKTFWEPTSSNTIMVAADTANKRKEMQDSVMKTFYLRNVSSSSELQEAGNILKGILDVQKMQLIPDQNAIILRGTLDQMVLAQKLLSDIDKPKPEVVIDIAVLQVSRDRIKTLGVNPPTSASIAMVPNASSSTGTSTSGSGNTFTLNSFLNINATNFQVSFPGATLSVLMSDSDTKLIQNPEVRVLDNEKATLKIGDRIPVATGSFGAAAGGGGVSALVNTQFQYLDVGVNIDITPHIHSENEVTLKMTLEVSSVSGTENIGGISQPVIGQRRIEHETRLQDGEVNLVGGILEDTETHSLSGYPWLAKLPILKYLFGQEDKERQENEIVFAITPHIVRAQEVTDENLRVVDLGRGSSVKVSHFDPRKAHPSDASAPQAALSTGGARSQESGAKPPASHEQKAPESPKTPVASPGGTVLVPAAPNEVSGPPKNSVPSAPTRPSGGRTPAARGPATPAAADPCPSGLHYVGQENGAVTCAFN